MRILWIWLPTFNAGEIDTLPAGFTQTIFLLPFVCWFGGLSLLYGFWFEMLQLKSKSSTAFLTRTKYVVFVTLLILLISESVSFGIAGYSYNLGSLVGAIIMAIYVFMMSILGGICIKLFPRLAGIVPETHRRILSLSRFLIIGNIVWVFWIFTVIIYFLALLSNSPAINVPDLVISITYIHRLFETSFSCILLIAIEHNPIELAKWFFCGIEVVESSSKGSKSVSVESGEKISNKTSQPSSD